jgi:hypothetical protein
MMTTTCPLARPVAAGRSRLGVNECGTVVDLSATTFAPTRWAQ